MLSWCSLFLQGMQRLPERLHVASIPDLGQGKSLCSKLSVPLLLLAQKELSQLLLALHLHGCIRLLKILC